MIELALEYIKANSKFIKYMAIKITSLFLQLLTTVVIVRKLSVQQYGIYSLAMVFIGLATTFGISWSSSVILYFGVKEKNKTGTMTKTFWSRTIILFFSSCIVILLLLIFESKINSYIGGNLVKLIIIFFIFNCLQSYFQYYLLAVNKQIASALLSLLSGLLYFLFVILISFDAKLLVKLNLFSLLIWLFALIFFRKEDILSFKYDREYLKKIFSFSVAQLAGVVGLYVINFGDNFVIKYYLTVEDVAVYNVGYKMFNVLAGISYFISSFYAPRITNSIVKKNHDDLCELYYKQRKVFLGIFFLGHVFLLLASKYIIPVLFGEKYIISANIFAILIIGSFFVFVNVFYIPFYNATNRYYILQMINIIQALTNIMLDFILVKTIGIYGAAVATVTAITITTLFSLVYCETMIKSKNY